MRSNVHVDRSAVTHEGGRAGMQRPAVELERAVATCLLFEPTFYEKGDDIATRIAELCRVVPVETVAALAVKARGDHKLRHVPLWLCVQLVALARGRTDGLVQRTLVEVIRRPDELSEFLALYWRDGRRPLAAQVKKGLAAAFAKFSAYQLAKWDRQDRAVKLRDVLFLCHARPVDGTGKAKKEDPYPAGPLTPGSVALYRRLVDGTLPTPDTWEVSLSGGADKKGTFERLLTEKKLGYMALLQNLRNMVAAGVDQGLIERALDAGAATSLALPFRFLAALTHAPSLAPALDRAMVASLGEQPRLAGDTVLVVDVSGSMDDPLSTKSELSRLMAASALAILLREVCERVRIFTFSQHLVEVPAFRGLGLVAAIAQSQPHGRTYLRAALDAVRQKVPAPTRVVVVTDEQSHDGLAPCWGPLGILLNVAPYKPGLDTTQGWVRVNGWSERVVDFIRVEEEARAR